MRRFAEAAYEALRAGMLPDHPPGPPPTAGPPPSPGAGAGSASGAGEAYGAYLAADVAAADAGARAGAVPGPVPGPGPEPEPRAGTIEEGGSGADASRGRGGPPATPASAEEETRARPLYPRPASEFPL